MNNKITVKLFNATINAFTASISRWFVGSSKINI